FTKNPDQDYREYVDQWELEHPGEDQEGSRMTPAAWAVSRVASHVKAMVAKDPPGKRIRAVEKVRSHRPATRGGGTQRAWMRLLAFLGVWWNAEGAGKEQQERRAPKRQVTLADYVRAAREATKRNGEGNEK
ncbi:MAG: hypothetical protein ACKPKO_13745, partial [Candidatus Fonsibacter sp.]